MASRSPTAVTPLPRTSSVPQTPLREPTAPPVLPDQPVPFPPPQTFDILPPLHSLLLRLLAPPANTEGPSSSVRVAEDATGQVPPSRQSSTAPQSQTQQQQQQHSIPTDGGNNNNNVPQTVGSSAAPGTGSVAAEIAALGPNAPRPLDAKDLPTEASSIKIRIQKAQAVVEGLPDVHRTVEEQEQEIKELEARIGNLKSVISEFGRRAG